MLMDLFLLLQPCSIEKLGMHRVYFSGGLGICVSRGNLGRGKFFLFSIIFLLAQRKTISGDNRIPCTDLQKT